MRTATSKKTETGVYFKHNLILTAVMLTALLLSDFLTGCQTSQTESQSTSQTEVSGPKAVTLFGTTVASRQQNLVLPWDAPILEWLAREGQMLTPDDKVFRIDRTQWMQQFDFQKTRRRALMENQAVQQSRIDHLDIQIGRWRLAGQADPEDGLVILEKLVRTTSRTRRNRYESDLLAFLTSIDGLSLHQTLVNLTRDDAQVKNLARPILAQWIVDLQAAANEAILQQKALRQQLLSDQAELAEIDAQLAHLDDWLSGQTQQNLGYIDQAGCFVYTGDACVLERGAMQDGSILPAGQTAATFNALPVNMVSVPVDEQLIPHVAVHATVQISPLYDRTLVWIGRVTFISEKADIINGETVIPVLVSTDEVLPGPGYTVVAKILPVVP